MRVWRDVGFNNFFDFMKNLSKSNQQEWLKDFKASQKRSLKERWNYSFIHTYKPILDDITYRSFESLSDYRQWCEKKLPSWLGYGKKL